jgi:mono/diheme cytochrome c family protein
MKRERVRRWALAAGAVCLLSAAGLMGLLATAPDVKAGPFFHWGRHDGYGEQLCPPIKGATVEEWGGAWYWVRTPEEEKRVVMSLFNRYCIRCHAADGRGVWDIPGVPDFTNAKWQAYHTDAQLVSSILEGRGAVMPPWRGTLSLDEAWAMARYLRTFVPGTEASRPDYGPSGGGGGSRPAQTRPQP